MGSSSSPPLFEQDCKRATNESLVQERLFNCAHNTGKHLPLRARIFDFLLSFAEPRQGGRNMPHLDPSYLSLKNK